MTPKMTRAPLPKERRPGQARHLAGTYQPRPTARISAPTQQKSPPNPLRHSALLRATSYPARQSAPARRKRLRQVQHPEHTGPDHPCPKLTAADYIPEY